MYLRDESSSPVAVAVEGNVTSDITFPEDENFQLQLSYVSESGNAECISSTPLPERQEDINVKSPNTSLSVRIDVSDSNVGSNNLSMTFDESSLEDVNNSNVSFIIILPSWEFGVNITSFIQPGSTEISCSSYLNCSSQWT